MTTPLIEPAVFIRFEIIPEKPSAAELQVVFKLAAEKPALGEAGAQAGDTVLLDGKTALVSLGKPNKLIQDSFRQAGGGLARWLEQNRVSNIHLDVDYLAQFPVADSLPALLEGLLLGSFRFDRYKKQDEAPSSCQVILHASQPDAVKTALWRSQTISAAVNLSRDWSHEPANIINPVTLAERAKTVAEQSGLRCTVLDEKDLEALGAGAIVAVGKGSKTPSRLIILEYPGHNPPVGAKPVVLVGKALTFDTGGYSLKDVTNIQTMKYDKCGGAGACRGAGPHLSLYLR